VADQVEDELVPLAHLALQLAPRDGGQDPDRPAEAGPLARQRTEHQFIPNRPVRRARSSIARKRTNAPTQSASTIAPSTSRPSRSSPGGAARRKAARSSS